MTQLAYLITWNNSPWWIKARASFWLLLWNCHKTAFSPPMLQTCSDMNAVLGCHWKSNPDMWWLTACVAKICYAFNWIHIFMLNIRWSIFPVDKHILLPNFKRKERLKKCCAAKTLIRLARWVVRRWNEVLKSAPEMWSVNQIKEKLDTFMGWR